MNIRETGRLGPAEWQTEVTTFCCCCCCFFCSRILMLIYSRTIITWRHLNHLKSPWLGVTLYKFPNYLKHPLRDTSGQSVIQLLLSMISRSCIGQLFFYRQAGGASHSSGWRLIHRVVVVSRYVQPIMAVITHRNGQLMMYNLNW